MTHSVFARRLRLSIESEYRARGYSLGWRLLYSPENVLKGAKVAFIGLNPGGTRIPAEHATFAMPKGSAYLVESWRNYAPSQSPLQNQVLALFERLNVAPESVLAGNMVPFRSQSWGALAYKQEATSFGIRIWEDILERARPRIIIGMGRPVTRALVRALKVEQLHRVGVEWGSLTAARGYCSYGQFIGLPHLSRFGIITRPASAPAVKKLLSHC